MGRPAGTVGKPKHSEGVHVYMGMSCRGVTTLKFVTGTHKHIDRYTNPKTQQLYRGVGSKEYNDVLGPTVLTRKPLHKYHRNMANGQ